MGFARYCPGLGDSQGVALGLPVKWNTNPCVDCESFGCGAGF